MHFLLHICFSATRAFGSTKPFSATYNALDARVGALTSGMRRRKPLRVRELTPQGYRCQTPTGTRVIPLGVRGSNPQGYGGHTPRSRRVIPLGVRSGDTLGGWRPFPPSLAERAERCSHNCGNAISDKKAFWKLWYSRVVRVSSFQRYLQNPF